MKIVRKKRPLVIQSLENVSKAVFRDYADLITELVGRTHGVYALYDDMGLYYVGKSINLKGRVHHHLKDRHAASWTHFSLYLLKHEEHVGEIESLLIRIADPKGNRVRPRGSMDGKMLKKLKAMIWEEKKREHEEMFSRDVKKEISSPAKESISLVGLVKRNTRLFRTYKGKDYKALLTPKGSIRLNGKVYDSPSAAGKSIVKHGCNGWRFWYLRDSSGDVISLGELRK